MKEEKPKCFTEEELKQLSNLAESTTRYTLNENDIKGKNNEKGLWTTHNPNGAYLFL